MRRLQKGLTLVELLMCLVVILGVLFVVAVAARSGFNDSSAKRLSTAILLLDDRIREAHAQRMDYQNLTQSNAYLEGIIPPEWTTDNGTTIRPVPGMLVTILPIAGTYSYSRYRMTWDGFVAPESCAQVLRLITPGMMRVDVTPKGGSSVSVSTNRGQVPTVAAIGAACRTGATRLVLENA